MSNMMYFELAIIAIYAIGKLMAFADKVIAQIINKESKKELA